MGICCLAKETQTGALYQPRGVGWRGRWEGSSKGRGYMFTYGWFSWQNSISLCPASFHTPRPNLPVTPGVSWLPTFAFQSPKMKRTSLLGVSSKRSCSVQFSHSVVSDSLRPHELKHGRPPCPSQTPGVYSNSCPSSQWCHLTISHPLLSPSPPAPNPSQHQGLFQQVNSSHQVAKVLEFQLQHQSFQWTPRTDLL